MKTLKKQQWLRNNNQVICSLYMVSFLRHFIFMKVVEESRTESNHHGKAQEVCLMFCAWRQVPNMHLSVVKPHWAVLRREFVPWMHTTTMHLFFVLECQNKLKQRQLLCDFVLLPWAFSPLQGSFLRNSGAFIGFMIPCLWCRTLQDKGASEQQPVKILKSSFSFWVLNLHRLKDNELHNQT